MENEESVIAGDEVITDEQSFETELNALTKTKDDGLEPEPEVKPVDVDSSKTTKEGETINGKDVKPGTAKDEETSKFNNNNALRRISRNNTRLKKEVDRLNARIKELEGSTKPEEILEANRLTTEANTYSTIVNAQEAEDWENRAYSTFGDQKGQRFIQYAQRYADHVNNNEPELSSYIDRPYGFILLNEWFQQMDNPSNAQLWQRSTPYEKGRILDSYYQQLLTLAAKPAGNSGSQPKPTAQKVNVPAVGGGRNTNATAPADDFGLALQEAQNRFKRR